MGGGEELGATSPIGEEPPSNKPTPTRPKLQEEEGLRKLPHKGIPTKGRLKLNPLSRALEQRQNCRSPTPLKFVNDQMTMLYDEC